MVFSSQSPIGVAIVGTGFGQKVHMPGFQQHPRTQIVAVYHRDLEKARAIAQAHNIPHACQTLEEIVSLPDVQAVSISTPPFLHYEMAKTVLEAGKHLLLEKPTALSVSQARQLQELAAQRNAIATMNFEFRFVPAWQRLAELISEGYVGQKRLIKVDWLVSSRADASRPWNWYAQKDQGGGALGAIGSHAFDYIAWLFGSTKRLCARLQVSIPERPDPNSGQLKLVDADDTCLIMLELADGTPCQICLSAATYQGRGHWVEVYGDRGTLILGSDHQKDYVHGFRLLGSQNGQPLAELEIPKRLAFPQVYADGRIAPFIRVVDQFVLGIDRRESLPPSLKEGVYSQLLMDLAHESNETGTWVNVPDRE
ncbi:gfo/Idh/MocA family oxidoreductase [Phormidesmis priestleyi ULC007]|uniref:Gfo/Idh/MocA family oxidoreductase n=1 Tax=Phormidesmis priestleyi ULC007 TaxID=1920490 RepID=A0A2T1DCG9_9CYAN|nr:Gfo/Idh/MocA family oxidoreductase [Phormidesmis priestleyi]PSB18200.1 gfo/Idh/MocA family oxidoreductase [Phormidesmis priestleyi ULC007]PZO49471.1 MAG: gfo/Idh/MocA family oxidoreductase [Phormidesmis priestleyi]